MLLLIMAFIVGALLGLLFFGAIWLTVKKALTSKTPAMWFFGSFVLRTGIVLIGFYYVSGDNWRRLLICLAGFIVARYIVTRFTKEGKEKEFIIKNEVSLETQS